ncbi:hypothetical protein GCM10007426_08440 [Alloalcanivorax dieselolei]|uniref:hypothetical protein n=1 Tax=Alloalcanivorax dieselolei TaxID=285091 RepID=UPI0011D26BE6|nr:hypothetical protein [Alloalcanivorax dieselolei]GGJ81731.1 hypothetical protein GCM10007426_08440 [Alloalcanivorax dieselolei]
MSVKLRGMLAGLFSLNAMIWLIMLISLAALLSLTAAAWIALTPPLGAALAALISGAGLLVVAAALGYGLVRANRPDPARDEAPPPAPSPTESVLESGLRPLVGDQTLEWARRNSGLLMIGAFTAGVAIAASPTLRRALTQVAGPVVTRKAVDTWRAFNQQD